MRINFTELWAMQNEGHQLAGRVFRHFADASANCDYVTPLKSTSIIIIYDVITSWQTGRGGSKTAGEATKKNMQKPIAFDVCWHNVSYTQCQAGKQAERASFTCCAYDMPHGGRLEVTLANHFSC